MAVNASAAVTSNAQSTDTFGNSVATITDAGLTVAAGSNIGIVVTLVFSGASPAGLTVTRNSASCTAITSASVQTSTPHSAILYGCLGTAAATGNISIIASWTGNRNAFIASIAFNGVDQTSVAVAFPHGGSNVGTVTPGTITITTASGNATVAAFVSAGSINASASSPDTNDPIYVENNATIAGGAANAALSGGASNTLSLIISNAVWGAVGTDVLAAGGGAAPSQNTLGLLGVGQ